MTDLITVGNAAFDVAHILLFCGLALALAALVWLRAKTREARVVIASDLERATDELFEVKQALRTQQEIVRQTELELARVQTQSEEQEKRFAEVAQGAVRQAHNEFLGRADERFEKLIEPITKNFTEFKKRVDGIEQVRTSDKSLIEQQVKAIGESLHRNTAETGKLVNALTAPKGGGRWGEMTLRNVMEQAGLSAHCDFNEQVHDVTDSGIQRPDAVINLPGDREIVIDSKVSLDAYMKASNAEDPAQRAVFLKSHADNVQRHVTTLASRSYQSNLDERVDFVAMFIPGENFFAAALEYAPDLLEKAYAKNVIVTTPSTLIGLAKTVSYVWRQEKMAENAREAAKLGEQLYDRIAVLSGHIEKLGKSLNGAVDNYNKMNSSLDKRVLPTARKFQELEIAQPNKALPEPKRIETTADVPNVSGELDFGAVKKTLAAE